MSESYFYLLPSDLKLLLLLYVPNRDIVTLLNVSDFKSLLNYESGSFWKIKVRTQYPTDFKENMPQLYYFNKATRHMEQDIKNRSSAIFIAYEFDDEYIKIVDQLRTLETAKNRIENEYQAQSLQYNNSIELRQYAKNHNYTLQNYDGKSILVKQHFQSFTPQFGKSDIQRWYNLLTTGSVSDIIAELTENHPRVLNGTVFTIYGEDPDRELPYFLVYINKIDDTYIIDYTIIDNKIILPTRFINDMRQLGLSVDEIDKKYNLSFVISESDI